MTVQQEYNELCEWLQRHPEEPIPKRWYVLRDFLDPDGTLREHEAKRKK